MATVKTLWAKVAVNLPRHPKLTRLAHLLKTSNNEAVGMLVKLWIYCLEFRQQGELTSPAEIAAACDWSGNPEELIKALTDTAITGAGFLVTCDQVWYVHDWTDFTGGAGETFSSRREEKRREEKRRITAAAISEVPHTSSAREEEKSREAKTQNQKPALEQRTAADPAKSFRDLDPAFWARLGLKPPKPKEQKQ